MASAAIWLLPASPLAAQVQQEEPDAEEVARTPLTDLNIDPEDIPEVLIEAEANPYLSDGLVSCNAIVSEIARLDSVLGPDYDLIGSGDSGLSRGQVAQSVVGSFIPFRGIVREVSGAAGDQRKARSAATAGMVRRGFLKGIGQERGCAYPARPRAEQIEATEQ
ncbi:hypothetical protein KCG45_11985 [Erythrobacter sp. WH131]|uniref:Uncharacterized protein n=1 Tax=Erythrobacter ani TaxID=2827235 RepID=A0ABS6SQZ9_9SPHN|nr:hypothetical protein [Erythrobacter ani]